MLLSLLLAGSSGQTAEQLRLVLGFEANTSSGDIIRAYSSLEKNWGLRPEAGIANSIWLQEGFHPSAAFANAAMRDFAAPVQLVDFRSDFGTSRVASWVRRATKGDAPTFRLSKQTIFLALSVLRMSGVWDNAFDRSDTRKLTFKSFTRSVPVSMMRQSARFNYFDSGRYQYIEVPLKDGFSMFVSLPRDPKGHPNSAALLQQLEQQNRFKNVQVDLSFPRLDIAEHTDLVKSLEPIGLNAPFSSTQDFWPIFGRPSALSDVFQDISLHADERGVKATVLSGASTIQTIQSLVRPIEMNVNHPFAFALLSNRPRLVVLQGEIINVKMLGAQTAAGRQGALPGCRPWLHNAASRNRRTQDGGRKA